MQKTIDLGKDVCFWPDLFQNCKDINEMVLKGFSTDLIRSTIDNNTYNGLRARLEFAKWRKI
jgi:hypothetical protein